MRHNQTADMATKPRKPISPLRREDAARLKMLWDNRQPKVSQMEFALQTGIGDTQGIIWQYLNGHIPLNMAVTIKFAQGLGCKVADISPEFASQLDAVCDGGAIPPVLRNDMLLRQLITLYAGLSHESRDQLVQIANKRFSEERPISSVGNPYGIPSILAAKPKGRAARSS